MANVEDSGRRAFLRQLARGAILAGLVGGVGALTSRHGESCVNQGICRNCGSFDDCTLPQALSAKHARARRP